MDLRRLPRRLLFIASGSLLLFVVSELSLQLLAAVFPKVHYLLSPPWLRVTMPDPDLGYRPSPYYPGHDDWGFRNAQVPKTCDVLAIGDSMTYGYSAQPGESWPSRIEERLGVSLYNMSFGGYGPCEYLQLLRMGLRLEPRVVIVSLFLGNDISDSYRTVYLKHRKEGLKNDDPAVQSLIAAADRDGLLPDIENRFLYPERDPNPEPESFSLHTWVSENLATWGLVRQLRFTWNSRGYKSPFREDSQERDRFEIASKRPQRYVYDGTTGSPTTFLPPRALALALNKDDPRIAEGYRILEAVYAEMQTEVEATGAKLAVILIPTKERVYRDLIAEKGGPGSAILLETVANELLWTKRLEAFFAARHLPAANSTELLHRALIEQRQPYQVSEDGHPNGIGYAEIANSCEALLRDLLAGR